MNRIREVAEKKKVKISEIIKSTGLAKSYVYDIINGKCNIQTFYRVYRIR
jgi:predicted DNA-binding transcriptional regulator AlpA